MKVFNAILGIFAIFAAIYTVWFPGVSFLNAGWIITILLSVWGACALFESLCVKSNRADNKWTIGRAILALLGGMAAAVITVISIFYPALSLAVDLVVVYMFVTWLILSGITSIVSAVKVTKKSGSKWWIVTLILGILTVIAGVYGGFHLLFMIRTMGMLLGVLLMVYGVRLLASVFEQSEQGDSNL